MKTFTLEYYTYIEWGGVLSMHIVVSGQGNSFCKAWFGLN